MLYQDYRVVQLFLPLQPNNSRMWRSQTKKRLVGDVSQQYNLHQMLRLATFNKGLTNNICAQRLASRGLSHHQSHFIS